MQDNNTEKYSANDEGKTVAVERFIWTLKKCYKYITSVSKNVYFDKLDDIVNKYNNAYYSAIKTKPVDVKSNTYIDFSIENNEKESFSWFFLHGDYIRILK